MENNKEYKGFAIIHPIEGFAGFGHSEEQCWNAVEEWAAMANSTPVTREELKERGVQVVRATVSWEEDPSEEEKKLMDGFDMDEVGGGPHV